jgi:hypothetical protein
MCRNGTFAATLINLAAEKRDPNPGIVSSIVRDSALSVMPRPIWRTRRSCCSLRNSLVLQPAANNDARKDQPAKVQVQICILLLGRVLLHIRTDVGRKEAMNEMLFAAITEMVEELQMPSTLGWSCVSVPRPRSSRPIGSIGTSTS